MGHIGWATVDEFEGIGFKHESQEFLIRFCFKNYGFAVEAITQEDFIGRKITKSTIAKDETIIHVSVMDKEMVIRENLLEVDGPNPFDGYHH